MHCWTPHSGYFVWMAVSVISCSFSALCKELGITAAAVCLAWDVLIFQKVSLKAIRLLQWALVLILFLNSILVEPIQLCFSTEVFQIPPASLCQANFASFCVRCCVHDVSSIHHEAPTPTWTVSLNTKQHNTENIMGSCICIQCIESRSRALLPLSTAALGISLLLQRLASPLSVPPLSRLLNGDNPTN